MILEICANSFQSAKNAQEAGAHRIELCQELQVGGITPSYGLLKKVCSELTIKTYVLIRPRSGHFVYNDDEIALMKNDIELCKELGCHGIVSGALNADNTLDVEGTKALVEAAKPLPFTFHRAFDDVPNPLETLEQLIALGVSRILTSGQQSSADKGVELLIQLKAKAQDKLTILPGKGVHAANVTVFKAAGFNEVHASASKEVTENHTSASYSQPITVSDVTSIKAILDKL